MLDYFHFSFVGLIYILLLMIPNMIWTKYQPLGYQSNYENKILVIFERIGQVLVTTISIFFLDISFDLKNIYFDLSILFMIMYEICWIRYFMSERTMNDFYQTLLFIPVPLAILPILAFLCISLMSMNMVLMIAVSILAIGHIGIHLQHKREGDA